MPIDETKARAAITAFDAAHWDDAYIQGGACRDLLAAALDPPAEAEAEAGLYLIRKGGLYYRPRAEGYTYSKAEAGRYTLAEAELHSHPNGLDGPRDGISYEPAAPVEADDRSSMERLAEILRETNFKPTRKYLGAAFLGYDYARRYYATRPAVERGAEVRAALAAQVEAILRGIGNPTEHETLDAYRTVLPIGDWEKPGPDDRGGERS